MTSSCERGRGSAARGSSPDLCGRSSGTQKDGKSDSSCGRTLGAGEGLGCLRRFRVAKQSQTSVLNSVKEEDPSLYTLR